MITVRFAVCSECDHKPVTRAVCDSRAEYERTLEQVKKEDGAESARTEYWIAELGPECDGWRPFVGEAPTES